MRDHRLQLTSDETPRNSNSKQKETVGHMQFYRSHPKVDIDDISFMASIDCRGTLERLYSLATVNSKSQTYHWRFGAIILHLFSTVSIVTGRRSCFAALPIKASIFSNGVTISLTSFPSLGYPGSFCTKPLESLSLAKCLFRVLSTWTQRIAFAQALARIWALGDLLTNISRV
jgi:hypothetical protein